MNGMDPLQLVLELLPTVRFAAMSTAPMTYFAARKREEIGKYLIDKLTSISTDKAYSATDEYANAYTNYYGRDMGFGITSGVTRGGSDGELAEMRINYSRALAKALLSIVTGPKITWRPVARTGDVAAQAATTLAINVLEDYWKNHGVIGHYYRLVEQAIAFSEGFSFPEWDLAKGPVVSMDEFGPIRGGDFTFHNLLPWDVFRDNRRKSYQELQWKFVRLYKNKWDLVRLNRTLADGTTDPSEVRDRILSASSDKLMQSMNSRYDSDNDIVPVWYFFHDRTPALPSGREIIMLSEQCVLSDDILTYDKPIHRLAADVMFDTPHAWSSFWDTLGVQELHDSLQSSVATNLTTLATQSISAPIGTNVSIDSGSGMRIVWYPANSPKGPEALQLAKSPPEIFPHMKDLQQGMRQIMGLNDVALGQPETAQMNAQAFAVLASMAVQQASPFQSASIDTISDIGTHILKESQSRMTQERQIQMTGKASKHLYSIQTYSGKSLKPVDRVSVDIGNPMEQRPEGRAAIMEHFIQLGFITNTEQYTQVQETGRLEPATRAIQDENLLIMAEREQLMQGINPPVHAFHNHMLHFRENTSPTLNPDGLQSPEVLKAVHDHAGQHYFEFYGVPMDVDPMVKIRVRVMLGQQPPELSPEELGMQPAAAPGGPPEGAPPPGPGGPIPPGAAPPSLQEIQGPPHGGALPPPPDNPMTGQPFNMQDGGGIVSPPGL